MIRRYIFSDFNNLNIEKILEDILQGYMVIIEAHTEKMNFIKVNKFYLRKIQLHKMNRYTQELDKLNYLIGHSIINLIFSEILKCDIDNIENKLAENGKPYIKNDKNIKFNIAHSKGCVILALSIKNIGIDVEFINKDFSFRDIINTSFSRLEIEFIKNNVFKFYKLWVAKEAYLKWEGIGLLKSLEFLEVIEYGEKNICLKDKQYNRVRNIKIYELFENYVVGICF